MIPYAGSLENNLSMQTTPEAKKEYLEKLTLEHEPPQPIISTLPKVIVTGYAALQLIYFFTGGPDEVRAWTIRKNTKAPQAAGTIHSDFETAFIMAEVMKFDDLKEQGSESAVKSVGKYTQKGKDYVVLDGDIIYFKAGQVTAPKKK